MTLAAMLATDRDALICDMAEAYGIYDLRALPVRTLAALAAGLRDDSRIKMKLSGTTVPTNTLLFARMTDILHLLLWAQTKDGQKNRNRPKSIVDALLHRDEPKDSKYDVRIFRSPEEFMNAWNRQTGGGRCGD